LKKHLFIAGARPQYVKLAALQRAFEDFEWWHTGQHPDPAMSEGFWTPLGLKNPSKSFIYGAFGTLLDDLEIALKADPPDRVLVVGDTNSALAGALAAHRLGIPVAHVEAGLRSFDLTMPEERNRRLIDTASDLWFCTEQAAVNHLLREGAAPENVHLVGNVMIDTLILNAEFGVRNAECGIRNAEWLEQPYILATFHRPSNVDTEAGRAKLEVLLERAAAQATLIFITHPRNSALAPTLPWQDIPNSAPPIPRALFRIPHSSYHEFLSLLLGASVVLTDSGGVQDECAFLGKPCITFRANTERPVTVSCGSNVLCDDPFLAVGLLRKALNGCWGDMSVPPLWDGGSALRIVKVIESIK